MREPVKISQPRLYVRAPVPTPDAMNRIPFETIGPALPDRPVVVSVPHGGRDYPPALLAALRGTAEALRPLEDRHVDTLARAAWAGETMVIAHRPRAWIDLNRSEEERDVRVDEGAGTTTQALRSPKVRAGLGLIPRRASGTAELWRRRFTDAEVRERIATDHRPYHAHLSALLAAAHARFGVAVLVDLHSMPPLGPDGAQVVLGDRFGRSMAERFVARADAVVRGDGLRVARNTPYAGGHILAAHARAPRGIHAIQVEIDRALYLDAALDAPGAGFAATAALVRALIAALTDEALAGALPVAAE